MNRIDKGGKGGLAQSASEAQPTNTKSLTLVVELTYNADQMHGDDLEARDWFFEETLGGDHLTLHDNGDLGDEIGEIKLIYWVKPEGEVK